MISPNTIETYVRWSRLAPLLGKKPATTLPLSTKCPVCQTGKLTIDHNVTTNKQWHYCEGCGSCGDLIELAARFFKCSYPEAIQKILAEGIPIPQELVSELSVEKHLYRRVNLRKQTQQLWTLSQRQLIEGNLGTQARHKLGLAKTMNANQIEAGPAKIFGVCTSTQVSQHLKPLVTYRAKKLSGVAIPFFLQPGIVSQYHFYLGKTMRDVSLKRINVLRSARSLGPKESGLAGLLTVKPQHSKVIAMEDVLLMGKWQMKHFSTALNPMPIVCWDKDTDNWSVLDGKQIIFWSNKPSVALVNQLRKTNGKLTIFGPVGDSAEDARLWLRRFQPTDIERKIFATAMPWKKALKDWFTKAPFEVAFNFYSKMLRAGRANAAIAAACWDKNQTTDMVEIRYTDTATGTYREAAGITYFKSLKGVERVLFEACIQIKQIYSDDAMESMSLSAGKAVYSGVIKHQGKDIRFEFTGPVKNFTTFIIELLAVNGIGCALKPADKLLTWVVALSKPKISKRVKRIGWDGKKFQFKSLMILPGKESGYRSPLRAPENAPGPRKPSRLRREAWGRASLPGPETELCWAVLRVLIDQITARARNQPVRPVLYCGEAGFPAMLAIMRHLRCPNRHLSRVNTSPAFQSKLWVHRWPQHITWHNLTPVSMTGMEYFALNQPSRYFFLRCPEESARMLHACGGFQAINCQEPINVAKVKAFPMQAILVAFLRNTVLSEFDEAELFLKMQQWLEDNKANTTSLKNSSRWLLDDTVETNIRLAAAISHSTKRTFKACNITTEGIEVSHDDLAKLFYSQHKAQPQLDEIPNPLVLLRSELKCLPTLACAQDVPPA